MYNARCIKLLLPLCWLIVSLYYIMYSLYNVDTEKSLIKRTLEESSTQYSVSTLSLTDQTSEEKEDSKNYLIDTPGCSIPNYLKSMRIEEAEYIVGSSCGTRAVFVEKISDEEIAFTIDNDKMKLYTNEEQYSCCYQFATPAIIEGKVDCTELRYSSCINFQNNDKKELKEEFITVTCALHSSKNVIYEDTYVILKKLKRDTAGQRSDKKPWNVLILGMDTMSRARAYSSLPQTVKYMLQNDWLDYRAYQKVGYNTFPNVMSLMTGRKMSTIFKTCSSGMDNCNHLIIWSEFKKAGYMTATGEEYLRLPDTFSKLKFISLPTDHYLRPLFLTGESSHGNVICTKKTPSAKHILDYASMFANAYKDENFFGMFWFNSYSHNLNNIPNLIDKDIMNFFSILKESGILNNTFVYFLSDHGIRNGKMRVLYESYYEERLPMFFLWVPTEFRNNRVPEYKNLQYNQNRLITPYDLYLTLYNTVTNPEDSTEMRSEGCPGCTSIFNEVGIYRTCEEAGVTEKWCTCHEMTDIDYNDDDVVTATNIAVVDLQNKMRTIKSTHCMKCEVLKLKTVLRTHKYRDESRNSTYYVVAFVMSPGDVAYESTVVKQSETFTLILPTYTISVYNTRGNCVVDPNDRAYCVCRKLENCT